MKQILLEKEFQDFLQHQQLYTSKQIIEDHIKDKSFHVLYRKVPIFTRMFWPHNWSVQRLFIPLRTLHHSSVG